MMPLTENMRGIVFSSKLNEMTGKEARKALDNAIKQWVKADVALQYFSSYFVFDGFGEFEPKIAFVGEDSILLSYEDGELYAEEAIKIMEANGCITPNDF